MHNQKNYGILFQEKPEPDKKVGMLFVYIVLGISLCVFGASALFSSYAKGVFFNSKPDFERQREKIQDEIRKLELEENALTDVERVRSINKELGLVDHTIEPIELLNK